MPPRTKPEDDPGKKGGYTVVEVKNITKKYGPHKALDDVSFSVNDGEILGFLGPNGAGKSTAMNIITGYICANSGKVLVDGCDVCEQPQKVRKELGYLPEIPPLYPDMTVNEYLYFVYDLKKCKLPKLSHLKDKRTFQRDISKESASLRRLSATQRPLYSTSRPSDLTQSR